MFNKNIVKLRKAIGLSQYDVAEKLGLNQSSVAMWETGRNIPSGKNLIRLAELLNVTVEQLTGVDAALINFNLPPGARRPDVQATVYRPLLGRVHAGDATEPDILDEHIPLAEEIANRHPNAYFLQVEGNCMNKVYQEGDYILIDPDVEPKNGSIAVVSIEGSDYVMRRLLTTGKTLILSPDSYDESYEDLIFTQADDKVVQFCGTVVWHQASSEMD